MDKREEILNNVQSAELKAGDEIFTASEVKEAMDEYMKATCLELLEYMAKNNIECGICKDGPFFLQKKDMKYKAYTAEQLFENFL